MENTLNGKTYLVTGATSGIGLAVAEILVSRGANVIGIGRSAERGRQARQHLSAICPAARVDFCTADLSLQSQVKSIKPQVERILRESGKTGLDGLVNNAGTFTFWLALTQEGIETQWAVNHLAPFLLSRTLLPLLEAAPAARIVTVSSDSHYSGHLDWDDLQIRRRYNGLSAYENTKLANVLFTSEFNRRAGARVKAFAADPGLVKTDIGLKGTPALVRWFWDLRRSGGVRPEYAAGGIVFLLTEPAIQDSPEIYWKDSRPKRSSRLAQDPSAAARLWAQSEKMCGL